jgi:hypothetical protein
LDGFRLLWSKQEVYVIGHQDIGVELAFGFAERFT